MKEELIDRFGVMPEQTQNLIIVHQLRLDIEPYDVEKIDAGKSSIEITFKPDANIDPIKLIDLIQANKTIKMNGPKKIKSVVSITDIKKRSDFITKLLKEIV